MNATALSIVMGALLALVAVAAGCGSASDTGAGADGGSNDGGGGGDGSQSANGGPIVLANIDERCDDGPTGREVLAHLREAYAGTYTPPDKRPADRPWKGATATSAMTISARYSAGAVLCTPRRAFNCPPGAPCAAPQGPTISVGVEMTFRMVNGTFAEAFTAEATLLPDAQNVNWAATLPATKIAGTYPIAAGAPDTVRLVFAGQFAGAMGVSKNVGSVSEVTSSISMQGGSWSAVEDASDAGSDAKTD